MGGAVVQEQVKNSLPNMQRKNIQMVSFVPLLSLSTDIDSEHRRRFVVMVLGFPFPFPLPASREPLLSVPAVCFWQRLFPDSQTPSEVHYQNLRRDDRDTEH